MTVHPAVVIVLAVLTAALDMLAPAEEMRLTRDRSVL